MKKTNAKRIWTKDELILTYYLAKYGEAGLGISEEEIVDYILLDTTRASLNMQKANFNHLMNIDGPKLSDYSQLQKEVFKQYQNFTTAQLRKIVISYIESKEGSIQVNKKKKANKEVEKRKAVANEALDKIYQNKVASLKKHRRLRKI